MRKLLSMLQVLTLLLVGATASAEVASISPDIARDRALAGEIVLIDIRRPDEWTQTGVPDVALLVDMTDPDFMAKIAAIRAQSPGIPLALSCRSGGRSGRVTAELDRIGMPDIIDVVGGFSGSRVDPGWEKRNLPTRAYGDPVNPQIVIVQP